MEVDMYRRDTGAMSGPLLAATLGGPFYRCSTVWSNSTISGAICVSIRYP